MITAAIIVASILGYTIIGGIVGGIVYRTICDRNWVKHSVDVTAVSVLASILWPLSVLVCISVYSGLATIRWLDSRRLARAVVVNPPKGAHRPTHRTPEELAAVARQLLELQRNIPPKERFESLVKLGLIDESGRVMPKYGGTE